MATERKHAESSVKIWGGEIDDYLPIHIELDRMKAFYGPIIGRFFTHNTWYVETILPILFGDFITNSKGRKVAVKDIAYQHIQEDFGNRFIPTIEDYLRHIEIQPWMYHGAGKCSDESEQICENFKKKLNEQKKGFGDMERL